MPSSRKYLGDTGLRQLWTNIQEKIEEEISEIDLSVSGVDLSNYVSYADLSNYISVSSSDDLTWDHLSEGGLFTGNLSTFGAAIINAGWGWANYHDAYLPSDTTLTESASSDQKSDIVVAFSPDSWNIENGAYDRVFNFIDDTGTATSMSVSDVSNESNGTTLVIQNYSINDNSYIPYGITKAYIPEFGWTSDDNGNDLLYIVHPTQEEIDGSLVNPSYGIITEKNISNYLPIQEEIYNILLSYNLITASQLPDAFRYLSNN